MMNKAINPCWSVLFFLIITLLAVFFHLPETVTLLVISLYFLSIIACHPKNGIYFLLLIIPFFLGNSKWPYYVVFEFFAYSLIIVFLVYYLMKKREFVKVPYLNLVILFFALSVLSLPLNLKEFYFEIKGSIFIDAKAYLADLFKLFCISFEDAHIYWLRTLANLFSGVAVYCITVYFFRDEKEIIKIFPSMGIVFLITMIFGYLFLYDFIPHQGTYLTLSLIGQHGGALTAFAYNRGYLAQYLIVAFPFIAYYLFGRKDNRVVFVLSLGVMLIFLFSLPLTKQRGAIFALACQVLLFLLLALRNSQNWKKTFFVGFAVILVSFFFLLSADYTLRQGVLAKRLLNSGKNPGLRPKQWAVALTMVKMHPLLGVGLGRHHHFFPAYCEPAGVSWEENRYWGIQFTKTTAHNLYLNILAEQGLLGLLSFLLLIGVIWGGSFKKLKLMSKEEQRVAITIIVSLGGWLAYGITQHMFYIRSMQVFFWIMLGFLAVLLRPYVQPVNIPGRWIGIGIICFVLLLGYRLAVAYVYYVP